jgi:hypothetical protein
MDQVQAAWGQREVVIPLSLKRDGPKWNDMPEKKRFASNAENSTIRELILIALCGSGCHYLMYPNLSQQLTRPKDRR